MHFVKKSFIIHKLLNCVCILVFNMSRDYNEIKTRL